MPSMSPFNTLALDTCSSRGSIALLSGEEIVGEVRLATPETHSERLLRIINFLLRELDWELKNLNLIAAGIGPGSFTGIRIGISTALGLAQSLSLPYAGVSNCEALAVTPGVPFGSIAVVMDAQRGQVYYAEYVRTKSRLRNVVPPMLETPLLLKKRLARRTVTVLGDGALRYRLELGLSTRKWPRLLITDLYLAAAIGRTAMVMKSAWRQGNLLGSETLYVRPPDAVRLRSGRKR